MKKTIVSIVAILSIAAFFGSCKKSDPSTPNNTTGPTPVSPVITGVDGALVSIRMDYSYTNAQIPIPITLQTEIGGAVFYTGGNYTTYIDAGTVSVNSNNLDKGSDNAYTKLATAGQTPADLGFGTSSSWNVAGSGNVPAFSYDHTGSFPDFSGTLPTTITRASGLTINISSQTSNADSVYVLVAAGSQSILKRVSASAGTATISAAELQNLPAVTDNTAIIEVDPFKVHLQTIGSKQYAFVKEYAKVSGININ